MTIGQTNAYQAYQNTQTQTPQTVKVKDPRDGVEHTAYYYYSFDEASESFKPSSNYEKLKELSKTYNPENMSENEMSALVDDLYKSGVIGSSDAATMKISYSTLAKSLNDGATNGYTGTDANEKTNLLGIYKKMLANAVQNGATTGQTRVLTSKTDILGMLDDMRDGKIKDQMNVKVTKLSNADMRARFGDILHSI